MWWQFRCKKCKNDFQFIFEIFYIFNAGIANIVPMMKTSFLILLLLGAGNLTTAQNKFIKISENTALNTYDRAYGIYIGDFDQDAYEDLLITYDAGGPRLFKNLGNVQFEEVTLQMGLNTECDARTGIWVDYDNDGDLDLVLGGRSKPDVLYRNEGHRFSDVSSEMHINKITRTWSVNISDLDYDQFLDIYHSNFLQNNTLYHLENNAFADVAGKYGITANGLSMGSIFFDYDNDGDDDLYLVHDGESQANILYRKEEDGSFTDVGKSSGTDVKANGMGVDIGDINNDGCLDIYVTNLYHNNLLLNNCDGTFSDISHSARVDDYGMGWGVNFLDFDNDGWLDILVANDSHYSPHPNVLYRNNGDLTFTPLSGLFDNEIKASYGCTVFDINLDGYMDLIIANIRNGESVDLWKNETRNDNNWIGIRLEGQDCNRQAIGARIELRTTSGLLKVDQVTGGNGYASQESAMIHFGLGQGTVEEIRIIWPQGSTQIIDKLSENNYYKIKEGGEPEILFNINTSTFYKSNHGVKVYPNPASKELNITHQGELNDIDYIYLYDQQGILMAPIVDWSQNSFGQLTLVLPQGINPGLYFLNIKSGDGFITKKVYIVE